MRFAHGITADFDCILPFCSRREYVIALPHILDDFPVFAGVKLQLGIQRIGEALGQLQPELLVRIIGECGRKVLNGERRGVQHGLAGLRCGALLTALKRPCLRELDRIELPVPAALFNHHAQVFCRNAFGEEKVVPAGLNLIIGILGAGDLIPDLAVQRIDDPEIFREADGRAGLSVESGEQ